jgi:hypothetical protein
LLVLYASGKGRHRLELSVRLRLSRQGGWRVAEGVLPAAPATALSLTVPKPQTELRLGRLSDRRGYETGQADEKIETALGADGAVSIQWRPKVAEALLDRSLTARSTAVLDVQEDGLRLVWRLQLEFGRSQREEFRVGVPADYLLEKVEGQNVRGWQRDQQQPQTVDIMLLKPAKDLEDFTFHLWRKGPVGQGGLTEFEVPVVSVGDAAINEGQLTIRRSPLLELRTLQDAGLRRIDADRVARVAGVERSEPPGGDRVELSQVRLFVPKTHHWFAFGGTMGLATLGEEDDLAAGFVSYTTNQIERLRQTMRGSGKFAKVRAAYNLKQLDTAMSQFQSARSYDANPNLKAQLKASEDALRRGKAELRDFEAAPQQAEMDNRFRLNTRYEGQKSSRSRNVVQDLGGNWFGQPGQAPAPGSGEANSFNNQWLDSSQLNNNATVVVTTDGRAMPEQAGQAGQPGGAKPGQPVIVFGGKCAGELQAQPKAPEVAQGTVKAELAEAGQATVTTDEETGRSGHRADDTVLRYQNRLEQQASRHPAVATTGSAVGLSAGDAFSADLDILPFAPESQAQAATRAESAVDVDALLAAVSRRVQPGGQREIAVRGATAVPAGVAAPTGLASLQLQLPEHEEDFYQVYRFSTPRGEVEITAWAVSDNLLTRLLEVAAVLVAVGVLGYLVRLARAGRFARLWGATGSTLMVCVGLLALLFGILPVAGLAALVAGIAIKVRRAAARSAAAGQPIKAEVVQR